MDLNKKNIIGKYEISDICLQSYPCQHYVKNIETGTAQLMFGDNIYSMLKNDGLTYPHFDCYVEFIRKRDNPTKEELDEKLFREKKMDEQMEKERKEREEREKITNTYKASSRLERLKLQNNIN